MKGGNQLKNKLC